MAFIISPNSFLAMLPLFLCAWVCLFAVVGGMLCKSDNIIIYYYWGSRSWLSPQLAPFPLCSGSCQQSYQCYIITCFRCRCWYFLITNVAGQVLLSNICKQLFAIIMFATAGATHLVWIAIVITLVVYLPRKTLCGALIMPCSPLLYLSVQPRMWEHVALRKYSRRASSIKFPHRSRRSFTTWVHPHAFSWCWAHHQRRHREDLFRTSTYVMETAWLLRTGRPR